MCLHKLHIKCLCYIRTCMIILSNKCTQENLVFMINNNKLFLSIFIRLEFYSDIIYHAYSASFFRIFSNLRHRISFSNSIIYRRLSRLPHTCCHLTIKTLMISIIISLIQANISDIKYYN